MHLENVNTVSLDKTVCEFRADIHDKSKKKTTNIWSIKSQNIHLGSLRIAHFKMQVYSGTVK